MCIGQLRPLLWPLSQGSFQSGVETQQAQMVDPQQKDSEGPIGYDLSSRLAEITVGFVPGSHFEITHKWDHS